ncbi:type II toxin-antitoxin system VapC family toxin [Microbacterium aureliae]
MIYLDSCIVIYATEDDGVLGRRARRALAAAGERLAISALVVHETLVAPLRREDKALLDRYATWFEACTRVDIDLDAYLRAAELRAANPGLRTVDALHLAAAELAECTALWTNDRRLAAASGTFAVDVIGRQP